MRMPTKMNASDDWKIQRSFSIAFSRFMWTRVSDNELLVAGFDWFSNLLYIAVVNKARNKAARRRSENAAAALDIFAVD